MEICSPVTNETFTFNSLDNGQIECCLTLNHGRTVKITTDVHDPDPKQTVLLALDNLVSLCNQQGTKDLSSVPFEAVVKQLVETFIPSRIK